MAYIPDPAKSPILCLSWKEHLTITLNHTSQTTWLNNYDEFVEEVMINFGLHNIVTNTQVELEQIVMQNNYKAYEVLLNSTSSCLLLITIIRHFSGECILHFQRGSRMGLSISTNLGIWMNFEISCRRSGLLGLPIWTIMGMEIYLKDGQ